MLCEVHIQVTRARSWLLLLAVIATGGCGAAGSASRSCRVDADCGGVAMCRSGTCQTTSQLTIAEPASGTVTKGTLHITVTVQGGSPSAVEIILTASSTDTTLATIGPPYVYDWDTGSTPEGTYGLRARTAGGSDRYESQSVAVTVDRTPPARPTMTVVSPTDAQPVPVSGTAEAGTTVTLYEGATQLATASVSAAGIWSAAPTLGDGTHELTARATDAAGNVSPSMTAEEVCIRANPTVLARFPPPGVANVWSRDPITVRFSRAVNSDSLVSLQYLVNGVQQSWAPSLALPSPDGSQTLTIEPGALPDVSSGSVDVKVILTDAIKDLAGNALQVPSDAWAWTVPEWQDLGTASTIQRYGGHVLTVTSSAAPVIAWGEDQYVMVAAWGPAGWNPIATWSNAAYSGTFALASDALGNVFAAHRSGTDLVVERWDGAAWTPLGSLNVAAEAAGEPCLAFDGAGSLLVAWNEGTGPNIYAKSWDGSAWHTLGTGAIGSGTGLGLTITSEGVPLVSWFGAGSHQTAFFSSGAWTPGNQGVVSSAQQGGVLRTSAAQKEYLAWIDTAVTPTTLDADVFGYLGFNQWGWIPLLGNPINVNASSAASAPSMTVGDDGYPVIAWLEGTGPSVFVRRWDGTAWHLLGGDLRTGITAASPQKVAITEGKGVVADREGVIIAAWADAAYSHVAGYLHVMRYNR
jgi:hypothetical protein